MRVCGLLLALLWGWSAAPAAEAPEITAEMETLMSLGSLRTVLGAFHIDHGHYPAAAGTGLPIASLKRQTWPIYIRWFPGIDGWYGIWHYDTDGQRYVLASPGADGRFDVDYTVDDSEPSGDDILVVDGELRALPELLESLKQVDFFHGQNPWKPTSDASVGR